MSDINVSQQKFRANYFNTELLTSIHLNDNQIFQYLLDCINQWNIEQRQENFDIFQFQNEYKQKQMIQLFKCLKELVNLRDNDLIQEQIIQIYNWYSRNQKLNIQSDYLNSSRTNINDISTQISQFNSVRFNKTTQYESDFKNSFLSNQLQKISRIYQYIETDNTITDKFQQENIIEKIDKLLYHNQKEQHKDHLKSKEMTQSMYKFSKKLAQLQADQSKKRCYKNMNFPRMPTPPKNKYEFERIDIEKDPFFTDLLQQFKYKEHEKLIEIQKQEEQKMSKQIQRYNMIEKLKNENENLAVFKNNFQKKSLEFDLNQQKQFLNKYKINQIKKKNKEFLDFERTIDKKKNLVQSELNISLKYPNLPNNPYDMKVIKELKLSQNIKDKLSQNDQFNQNNTLIKSQVFQNFVGKWKPTMKQDPNLLFNPYQPIIVQKKKK